MGIPLVSICCLAYNHEHYIRECLEGFLMQKTNFPFEILIHDDASTDGTEDVIREFEAKYPNVIKPLFEKENQWRKGRRGSVVFNIPRALGKYIALCEGDDYWTDPLKLQKQVDFLERNEEYVACFHNAWIENSINNTRYKYHNWNESREISSIEIIEIGGYVFPTAALMFRNYSNLKISTECIAGDLALSLELLPKGKFFCISDLMSVYRRHENGIYSGTLNDSKKQKEIEMSVVLFLEKMKKTFPKELQASFEKAIKKRVQKLLYNYNLSIYKSFPFLKYLTIRELIDFVKHKVKHAI